MQVSWRFLFQHPAHAIALGLGAGLSPIAPGTVGTAVGWMGFHFWGGQLTDTQSLVVLLGSLVLGWWACTVAASHLQTADPGAIVWDEIVAIWLILWIATPVGWFEHLFLFGLFRFFDAAKPGPVRWADQVLKGPGWRGGFGILFDDLVAACCTLVVFAMWRLW